MEPAGGEEDGSAPGAEAFKCGGKVKKSVKKCCSGAVVRAKCGKKVNKAECGVKVKMNQKGDELPAAKKGCKCQLKRVGGRVIEVDGCTGLPVHKNGGSIRAFGWGGNTLMNSLNSYMSDQLGTFGGNNTPNTTVAAGQKTFQPMNLTLKQDQGNNTVQNQPEQVTGRFSNFGMNYKKDANGNVVEDWDNTKLSNDDIAYRARYSNRENFLKNRTAILDSDMSFKAKRAALKDARALRRASNNDIRNWRNEQQDVIDNNILNNLKQNAATYAKKGGLLMRIGGKIVNVNKFADGGSFLDNLIRVGNVMQSPTVNSGVLPEPVRETYQKQGADFAEQHFGGPLLSNREKQAKNGEFYQWLQKNASAYTDLNDRAALAAEYGIDNYTGTMDQNFDLWDRMKADGRWNEGARRQNVDAANSEALAAMAVRPRVAAQPVNVPAEEEAYDPEEEARLASNVANTRRNQAIAAMSGRRVSDRERARYGAAYDAIVGGANPNGMSERQIADIQRMGRTYRPQSAKNGGVITLAKYLNVK